LPGIAYATTTGIYARAGNSAPEELAALPAGTQAASFAWSWDGRWLGWLSGPVTAGISQVHITDTTSRRTRSWPCAGCSAGAFANGHLLVDAGSSLMAYPEAGGPPTPVSLSGPALPGRQEILASTPGDAGVLFFAGDERGGALYETTLAGVVTLASRLSVAAGPGDDRAAPGSAGLTAISPDRKVLAYWCNVLGGDTGEPSDGVTIVDLATGQAKTEPLPANQVHPLRISAVWVDGADRVYAIAWPQPGNAVTVPKAAVTPHQYRLDNGHWTDTGARNTEAAGGGNGWIATLAQPSSVIDFSPLQPGRLVATLGGRQVVIADGVTAFSWNLSAS
jgi:hypothetical protein